MSDELTPEEWQYISVLIAQDINRDREHGIIVLADKHAETWQRIQGYCQWDDDE